VACYTNTKIPFISPEKNGPDPLPITGSSSRRRPRSPAKTAGSRPFPDRTAGSRQAGREPAVPRTERPDPARLDGIWPFPGQNGRIPPGWTESFRSRPASGDGWDLALTRPNWPDFGLFGRGLDRRGELSEIFGGMLCFRRGIFPNRWKWHFCLYVLKYFLTYFTIKLMWSHL
jgi:hypothetical protein